MDKSLKLLNMLHPAIRRDAINAYNAAVKATPKGVHPVIDSTLRTFDQQAKLYAQGRTTPGDIVTNSTPGLSFHQYGLALDFHLVINGKDVWDQNNWNWKAVINCFKDRGFEWGGDWKSLKDYPHLEKTMGLTVKQLLAKHNAGEFIPDRMYLNI